MKVFVARQPIFNGSGDVIAYELLYRNSEVNSFPMADGDQATTDVIINSFINIGIDEVSDGKPCFINFTENLLKKKLPTYFSPEIVVIEILETVEPSESLVQICKELKQLGYKIALDDFILNNKNPYLYQLLNYIDIIKIDIQNTPPEMFNDIEAIANIYEIKLLAEKVETVLEFNRYKEKNYVYFQGYFFSKPVIVSNHDIPTYFYSYIELLNHLATSEPNIDTLSQFVEKDISLSYKLLKLINSTVFHSKTKISSIKQAIVLLGLQDFQKWIYVLSVRDYQEEKSDLSNEIICLSLVRAKMCETLKELTKSSLPMSGFFMTGMFSLIDALLGVPMEDVLVKLPLDDQISNALRGQPNDYKQALDLVLSIEKGEWDTASELCNILGIEEHQILNLYTEALTWSCRLIREEI